MVYLRFIFLSSILASGWNDYDVSLLREYRLVRTNASTVTIFKKGEGFVVPSKITGLGIKKNLIYGICEKSKRADMPSVPGYFLIDTKKTTVKIGLTKTEWLNELGKYGISKEPTLKKPSRFWNVVNFFWTSIRVLMACILVMSLGFVYSRKVKKSVES